MKDYPTVKTVRTKPYSVYDSMKTRCTNPNASNYGTYGGAGVTICDEWMNDFQSFARWYVAECESLGLDPENHNYQLDKDILCKEQGIHPHVYSPTTCKLVSAAENVQHRTSPRATRWELIDPEGNELTVTNMRVFSETHGLSYHAMRSVTSGRTSHHRGYRLKD